MKSTWEEIVLQAISMYKTPFYISAWEPVLTALAELRILEGVRPVKHWLSFKTHPIKPLVTAWRDQGYGVEVVSEYEFCAALNENFRAENILVNGVAKHEWLPRYHVDGIRVHFDSLVEVEKLGYQARSNNWHIGIRCRVAEGFDPDEPKFLGQFGIRFDEVKQAARRLGDLGISVEGIHFHLRPNVSSHESYRRSIQEVANICREANLSPVYLDCGGGFPVAGERPTNIESTKPIDLTLLRAVLAELPSKLPSVQEIWFENGRFISARSCVLVVRVLDIKEYGDSRYVICDGGRTNHALVSDWEIHDIFTLPIRNGAACLTTVCGPTCMAFDRLIRTNLPGDIEIGDCIIWMNAGAYHIPWETRFSHGTAAVLWYDSKHGLSVAREKEAFEHWWGQWK